MLALYIREIIYVYGDLKNIMLAVKRCTQDICGSRGVPLVDECSKKTWFKKPVAFVATCSWLG